MSDSWKKVPNVPLMLVSAISEIYIGATTQKLPVDIPEKIFFLTKNILFVIIILH